MKKLVLISLFLAQLVTEVNVVAGFKVLRL